jgi:hypothetical protein
MTSYFWKVKQALMNLPRRFNMIDANLEENIFHGGKEITSFLKCRAAFLG